ncbi:hypothetical protein C8R44DRAFT_764513 [Mycena epipterygia]|nr:hypothetical protein C8R44DRAFT_764513 [Mycena epipterygia]
MTSHFSSHRPTSYLLALLFFPNVLAYTQCVKCATSSLFNCHFNNAALSVVAIVGIVIGILILLSIGGIIFAVVRYRRIRKFQRSYVQNAQANAAGTDFAPAYPSPAYHSHHTHMHHHNQALEQHNRTVEQINMQNNQLALQNSMMVTPATGIGATSGFTGM